MLDPVSNLKQGEHDIKWGHSLSTYTKFSGKLTFVTP